MNGIHSIHMKNNEVITGILIKKTPKSLVINVPIIPQPKKPLDPRYKLITIPYSDINYITEYETDKYTTEGGGKHKKIFGVTNTSPIGKITVGNQKLGNRINFMVREYVEPIQYVSRTEKTDENRKRIGNYRRSLPK
jgi:hypothetical protein